MERKKVYEAIDSERDYQQWRWDSQNTEHGRDAMDRTIDEFALYIQRYANKLTEVAGTTDEERPKLEVIRKIAALGVACGERHGMPKRDM